MHRQTMPHRAGRMCHPTLRADEFGISKHRRPTRCSCDKLCTGEQDCRIHSTDKQALENLPHLRQRRRITKIYRRQSRHRQYHIPTPVDYDPRHHARLTQKHDMIYKSLKPKRIGFRDFNIKFNIAAPAICTTGILSLQCLGLRKFS